jgi:hypothetical protein
MSYLDRQSVGVEPSTGHAVQACYLALPIGGHIVGHMNVCDGRRDRVQLPCSNDQGAYSRPPIDFGNYLSDNAHSDALGIWRRKRRIVVGIFGVRPFLSRVQKNAVGRK